MSTNSFQFLRTYDVIVSCSAGARVVVAEAALVRRPPACPDTLR